MEIIKPLNKIGNSLGLILPAALLKELGINRKKPRVRIKSGNGIIQIEASEGREDKIAKAAAKYIKKYHSDFKKLA